MRSRPGSRRSSRSGRADELVEELETLVREEPFRERLWRHLMLALYRGGRQADALAAYRRARSLLVEELGVEPGEELRELEQAILQHDGSAGDPAGRAAQPARAADELRRPRGRARRGGAVAR